MAIRHILLDTNADTAFKREVETGHGKAVGNAEEAFTFYKSVFGGEFTRMTRFKELSAADSPIPPEEGEKIMFIALPIGPTMLMGNDVPAHLGKTNEHENRSKIAITTEELGITPTKSGILWPDDSLGNVDRRH